MLGLGLPLIWGALGPRLKSYGDDDDDDNERFLVVVIFRLCACVCPNCLFLPVDAFIVLVLFLFLLLVFVLVLEIFCVFWNEEAGFGDCRRPLTQVKQHGMHKLDVGQIWGLET